MLLSKVSFAHLVGGLALQLRDAPGFARTLSRWRTSNPSWSTTRWSSGWERVGLAVMYRSQPRVRAQLGALIATVGLMALLIVRRPLWHYFLGFYWLFPAAAAYGLTLLLTRRSARRRDLVAVAAGCVMVAACNAWAYPDIINTYARYLDYFGQRAALARAHPAWVPAPWEFALSGFEATRDPARVFPFYGHRLDATLQDQRRHEDRANQRRPAR